MRLQTQGANSMREIETFVNEHKIKKADIVSILQSKDGTYFLTYYVED